MDIFKRVLWGLRKGVVNLIIEWPARRSGIDRLIDKLEKSGRAIEKKTASSRARENNQETLAHIIGIERWGQRRLKVALGEPLIMEEYDDYRPDRMDWQALQSAFRAARQETLSLSKSLRMAGVDPYSCMRHNQLGDLTLMGWLYYLNTHANIESLKIS